MFHGNRSHHFGHNERVKNIFKMASIENTYIEKNDHACFVKLGHLFFNMDQIFVNEKYILPQQDVGSSELKRKETCQYIALPSLY